MIIVSVLSSAVSQPGLWGPPWILTATSKVTRIHDGHSSVRRWIKTAPTDDCQVKGQQRTTNGVISQHYQLRSIFEILAHVKTKPVT